MLERTHYNLLSLNTFGVEAFCSRFIQLESEAEAQTVLPTLKAEELLIVGQGSNLLLTRDFAGTVLRSAIRGLSVAEEGEESLLRCGSGEKWDDVVAYAIERQLYGSENLSLIPGDVGAAAVQNIGAYGAEIADIIYKVEAVEIATGQSITFAKDDCEYAYRSSRFKTSWRNCFFITYVTLRLQHSFAPQLNYGNVLQALSERGISSPTALQLRETIIAIRREKLPDTKELGNAGSFFMNPIVERAVGEKLLSSYPDMPMYDVDASRVKLSAGWFIERCGWKGRSIGAVGVYEKNALVLVNRGGATGEELLHLCQRVQRDVWEQFGVALQAEVNII